MDFSAEVYESYTENLEEYGSDATLKSFAVLSKTEYTEEDVAKIAAYAAEHCGIPYDAIEDVCLLSVYTEFGGSEDTDTDTDDVVMCKIDGKWYINIQGPDGSVTSKSRIKNILEG